MEWKYEFFSRTKLIRRPCVPHKSLQADVSLYDFSLLHHSIPPTWRAVSTVDIMTSLSPYIASPIQGMREQSTDVYKERKRIKNITTVSLKQEMRTKYKNFKA